jgi:hypothetical protein
MKSYCLLPLALALPSVASAQTEDGVTRLSATEVEAIKEAAARRHANMPVDESLVASEELEAKGPLGNVHGEIGFGFGTGGYREMFGTAYVPIGEDGLLAFSFDRAQLNGYRGRYRR